MAKSVNTSRVKFLGHNDVWPTIMSLARSPKPKKIAVAYLTSSEGLNLRKGDVAVTDATPHAVANRQCRVSVLKSLAAKGVKLYSCDRLHAKVWFAGFDYQVEP